MAGAAAKERARELLKLVDMGPEYLDRYPHELSGAAANRCITGTCRGAAAYLNG